MNFRLSWPRAAILLAVGAALAAYFLLGLDDFLSFAAIKRERLDLIRLWQREPLPLVAGFVILNVTALGLSLPGAVLTFGLAAGAVFGPIWGAAIALSAVVTGDSLAFMLARYVLREAVERRLTWQAARANAGLARDGAFYLLALRLMAIVPYFVVNLTMGLTQMPLRVFAPVSFAGLLPITFLYVQAGDQLSAIEQASDVYSPRLLATFALLALLPLAARFLLRRWQGRTRRL